MMRPRDIFGIGVRFVGLWLLLAAVTPIYWALFVLLEPQREHKANAETYAVETALYAFFGLCLLKSAPFFVAFTYGEEISTAQKANPAGILHQNADATALAHRVDS